MSIAVVQVCGNYHDHLPGWLDSVRALTRQPDEVVLVAAPHPILDDLEGVRIIATTEPFNWGRWLNTAIAATSSDWVSWIGADDRYLPHALDRVDDCQADVLVHGLLYSTGPKAVPSSVTADAILQLQSNLVTVGSPFRRWLWERCPFVEDICADWFFWAAAAHAGATFAHTYTVDVVYAHGPDHYEPDVPATAAAIRTWLEGTA